MNYIDRQMEAYGLIEIGELMEYVKAAPDSELQWLIKWTTDLLADRCRNAKYEIERLEKVINGMGAKV